MCDLEWPSYKLCKIFTITVGNFCYIYHRAIYPLEIKKIKVIKRLVLEMKQFTCIIMVHWLSYICDIKNAYFDGEEIVQQISSPLHFQIEPTDCKSTYYKHLT